MCKISTAKNLNSQQCCSSYLSRPPTGRSWTAPPGKIPSISQHEYRDSFHGNEHHAWHKGHRFSPKRPCPASQPTVFAGVSLSPIRVVACGVMLCATPSGMWLIARSMKRSWRPHSEAFPFGLIGIYHGILCIRLLRCRRDFSLTTPLHTFFEKYRWIFKKIFSTSQRPSFAYARLMIARVRSWRRIPFA